MDDLQQLIISDSEEWTIITPSGDQQKELGTENTRSLDDEDANDIDKDTDDSDEDGDMVQMHMEQEECIKMAYMEHLVDMLHKLRNLEDVEVNGQTILNLLDEYGQEAIEDCPSMLLSLVTKACPLIQSAYYTEILWKVLEIMKTQPQRFDDRHLVYLLYRNHMDGYKIYRDHQERLVSLIQALIMMDDTQDSRNKCFRVLILEACWKNPERCESILRWTNKFIDLLKGLLQDGADPTWIPELSDQELKTDKGNRSAVWYFFQRVIPILSIEKDNGTINAIMELVSLFLAKYPSSYWESAGTPLHALISCEWDMLPENPPCKIYEQYLRIAQTIVETHPGFVDTTDAFGRCPLQLFICSMKAHEGILGIAKPMTDILLSDTNILRQDENGNTILHHLAEQYITRCHHKESSKTKMRSILSELINFCSSPANINIQNQNGENILHVLAKAIMLKPGIGYDLLDVVQSITTKKNVNTFDNNAVTPYTYILRKTQMKWNTDARKIFSKIEDIFLQNGADAELASLGMPVIVMLETPKDLSKVRKILKLFGESMPSLPETTLITERTKMVLLVTLLGFTLACIFLLILWYKGRL